MNVHQAQEEQTKLIDQFIDSLARLPKDLLVVVGFTTFLRDVLAATKIADLVGVQIATARQRELIEESISRTAELGRFMRGERIESQSSLAAFYANLVLTLDQIAERIDDNRGAFSPETLSQFEACSLQTGCESIEGVRLLTAPSEQHFQEIIKIGDGIVRRLNATLK